MTRTFKPHDYQQEALDWLYSHPRTALWMPMGGEWEHRCGDCL